jgi:hypothetical protein
MGIRHLTTEGMDSSQVAVLSSLLRLLRRSLSTEWRVNETAGRPDAVLTDVDTREGRLAWDVLPAHSIQRIIATSSDSVSADWLVLKPWHRSGDNCLVDVLNRLEDSLGKFEQEAPAGGEIQSQPIPISEPAAAEPPISSIRRPCTSGLLAPVPLRQAIDDAKSNGLVALLAMTGLPPIYVDAPKRLFACKLGTAALLHEFRRKSDLMCGIREIRHELPPANEWRSLTQLEWLARLSSKGTVVNDDLSVRLTRWPEFIRYPGESIHLQMASILLRQSVCVSTLAAMTGSTSGEAAAFVDACELLQLTHSDFRPSMPSLPDPPSIHRESGSDHSKAGFLRKVILTLLKRSA